MKVLNFIINCLFWTIVLAAAVLLFVTTFRLWRDARTERQIEAAELMGVIEPVHNSAFAEQPSNELQVIELEANITYAEETFAPTDITPLYDVPLAPELQSYIVRLCEQYQIPPELVLAVIEKESGCDAAATGDSGNSQGLMQIQPRWHKERMTRLACTDLYDPWQNVTVGVDILVELISQYQTLEMALMVYNAGAGGAQSMWFCRGIYSNEYSRTVLEIAQRLTTNKEV